MPKEPPSESLRESRLPSRAPAQHADYEHTTAGPRSTTPGPRSTTAPPTTPAPTTTAAPSEGLSSEEFERMMSELEEGIKRNASPDYEYPELSQPLSVDSALEAQKAEGITSPAAALRRTASRRAIERLRERPPPPLPPRGPLAGPEEERRSTTEEEALNTMRTLREKERKKGE